MSVASDPVEGYDESVRRRPANPVADLGSDDVIRFATAELFLGALASELGGGKLLVTSQRTFPRGYRKRAALEVKGVEGRLPLSILVSFSEPGVLGLSIQQFERLVPKLEALASRAQAVVQDVKPVGMGAAAVAFFEEEGGQTVVQEDSLLDFDQAITSEPEDLEAELANYLDDLNGTRKPLERGQTLFTPQEEEKEEEEKAPAPPGREESTKPSPIPDDLEGLRATQTGVIKLTDSALFLGLWLSQLSKRQLTFLGGPDGAPGTSIRLRLVANRVLQISATVMARFGPWLTVRIEDDLKEIEALLLENTNELAAILGDFLPKAAPHSELIEPSEVPPKPSSSPPLSNPTLAVGPESGGSHAALPAAIPEDTPSHPPKLENKRVFFGNASDLRKEIGANLKNGGLFVESDPIAITTKMRLTMVVGGVHLPDPIEAEVVFASGGKVGFSIQKPAEVCAALEASLNQEAPLRVREPTPKPQKRVEEETVDFENLIELKGSLDPAPNAPSLIELARERGEIGERRSTLELFDDLTHLRYRGIFEVSGDAGTNTIYFHNGNIAYLKTTPFDEATALGRILVRHKRLSESGLKTGLDTAKVRKAPLGRVLAGLGLVKSSDIVAALREQTRARLEATLRWSEGSFELRRWQEPPGDGELVVTRGLAILGHFLRRRFEGLGIKTLEELMRVELGQVVKPIADMESALKSISLTPKETRFIDRGLDGKRSLAEAIKLSGIGRIAALEVTATGLSLGLLEAAARSAIPRRKTSVRGQHRRAALQLGTRWDNIQNENYFEILGVHWTAHPNTFRTTFEHKMQEFDLSKGPYKDAPEEVQDLARKLGRKLKEAFDYLIDEDRRRVYRTKVIDLHDRAYAAEVLLDKGEVALLRGGRMEALEFFQTADELASSDRTKSQLAKVRISP